MKYLILLFLSLTLLGQSLEIQQNFQYIKDLIDRKQVREAQRQIDILRAQNENDPTLELYQTEIWIQIGEKKYRENNFKTAFENFKKAYEVYPSNPLVNSRYKELSGKILFDASDTQIGDEKFRNTVSLYPMGLQGNSSPENSIKDVQGDMNTRWSNIELFLGIICIQNLILILLKVFKNPKR